MKTEEETKFFRNMWQTVYRAVLEQGFENIKKFKVTERGIVVCTDGGDYVQEN
jgi:hypothetical protein